MGFFEKVGRRTEEIKQRMTDAAAAGAMFECANCGTELFTEPDACPECGSDAIVERVEESGGAPDAEEPSESEAAADDAPETAEQTTEETGEQRDVDGVEPSDSEASADSTDASGD